MKGNINLISYDCYQQATEKQLAGLKWKENRVYYISEIHNEKMQDEIYGYIDDRCRRLSLSTVVNDIYRFDLLKEFLNEKCTSCSRNACLGILRRAKIRGKELPPQLETALRIQAGVE